MNTPLSRRTALQAAGATVLAAGLTHLTATAARADDTAAGTPQLVTYPRPSAMPTNTSFKVRVRTAPDGEWQTLDIWRPQLGEINPTTGSSKTYNSSLAYFDFQGSVEVEITYLKGGTTKVRVRPDSYGITPEVLGDTLRFTLDQPRNLVVQINDDIFDCLHLFARAIEKRKPAQDDPDVLYYGPGVHTTADGTLLVPSGKTVYLDGGAVLKATVIFRNVEHAGIAGRGVLAGTAGGGALVESSRNISIGAVTVLNPNGYAVQLGEATGVTIKGLGSFSSKGWGDGIDVFCSSNVVIDGVFMRNSDDCIAIYTHRWDYYGDTTDVTVRNSTLWADVAHPINVGTHGNTDNPEALKNLRFKNLDIEDVRIEDFRWGQVIYMKVMYNTKYNTSVGRGIENVYVKNLSYTGTNAKPSLFLGYDAHHAIKDVTFENLVINGLVVADSMKKPSWYYTTDTIQWFSNEHVTNLKFITTAEAEAAAAS
jgi:hypothetical protein